VTVEIELDLAECEFIKFMTKPQLLVSSVMVILT